MVLLVGADKETRQVKGCTSCSVFFEAQLMPAMDARKLMKKRRCKGLIKLSDRGMQITYEGKYLGCRSFIQE